MLFIFWAAKSQASSSDLVLSEIMYDCSGADSGYEWLEIYNSGQDDVVVSSTWRFFDNANHNLNLAQGTSTIAAGQYFVLVDNAEIFLTAYPDFSATIFDTVMSLPNSSSSVALSEDAGQTYFLEESYDSGQGAAGNGHSLEKLNDSWQESCQLGGSPGLANQECQIEEEEVLENYWQQIIISEFLPNPVGSDSAEWIEIYNQGPETVDVNAFALGDNSARRFTIDNDVNMDLLMAPNSYLVFYKDLTGISLNNSSGDSVKLYNPDGNLQGEVIYTDSAKEGLSFALSDGGFVWTKEPTPGGENIVIVNQAPLAQIAVEGNFVLGEKINFSASGSSDPEGDDLDYFWEFGDGDTSSRENISHKFDSVGSYTVRLTVSDSEGAFDQAEFIISIYKKDNESIASVEGEKEITEKELVIDFFEDDLLISEFLANPVGSDDSEWVELFNTSDKTIDISSWYLDDNEGGSKPYKIASSTIIAAQDFILIKKEDSKISLNNSNDAVRLLKPDKTIWQSVEYEKVLEGQSMAWDIENSEWYESEPSPGQANIKKEDKQEGQLYLVSELESLNKGDEILVSGIVINVPDKDSRSFYLADFDGSFARPEKLLEIYSYYKKFPSLKVGELITISGELSRSDDLPRLKIKEAQQISTSGQIFDIASLEVWSVEDIEEDYLGSLVKVKGVVVKKSGQSIYLASDVEEEYNLRIYSKFSTKDLEIKKGVELIASGVLSESNGVFKLEPFSIDDIAFSQVVLGEKIELEDKVSLELSDEVYQVLDSDSKQVINKGLIYILLGILILSIAYVLKRKLTRNSHSYKIGK